MTDPTFDPTTTGPAPVAPAPAVAPASVPVPPPPPAAAPVAEDFDAYFAEQDARRIRIRLLGQEILLPASIPWVALLSVVRAQLDGVAAGDRGAALERMAGLGGEDLRRILGFFVGRDVAAQLKGERWSRDRLFELFVKLLEKYPELPGAGGAQGEAGAPQAGAAAAGSEPTGS